MLGVHCTWFGGWVELPASYGYTTKVGKDVASTAALVSTIVFVVIVLLILLPRVIDRITG